MDHNKQKPSLSTEIQQPIDDVVSDQTVNPSQNTITTVKSECERALTALRSGNHKRALQIMLDLSSKRENLPHSAVIHRVLGTVCVKTASIIDDPNSKQQHLKCAVESAKTASRLSPKSIEFAHFYANLLYEKAKDGNDYEEVVQECERALEIENPVDPGKEMLQEGVKMIGTEETRVLSVQNELRVLVQKANVASLSDWMKTLGTGEEKFRLVPSRRAAEDPLDLETGAEWEANDPWGVETGAESEAERDEEGALSINTGSYPAAGRLGCGEILIDGTLAGCSIDGAEGPLWMEPWV